MDISPDSSRRTDVRIDPRGGNRVPDAGLRAFLKRSEAFAREAGRDDLVRQLGEERSRLTSEQCTVLVVGEFGKGKSALVNALVAATVCGVSARTATAVPTVMRYGGEARARLVRVEEDRVAGGQAPDRGGPEVPVARIVDLSLRDRDDDLGSYSGLSVELPREVLRDGLVLVDTPGVGGGLAAAGAARTVRALLFADALVFVTDASAELTASELDFLRESLHVCPAAVCVVTKCDLYPQWRRVLELDRAHLKEAGLAMPVLPLSTVLRELALDTGDPAMAAESGYPVLVRALSDHLRRRQRSARRRLAVSAGVRALEQLSLGARAEAAALADPASRADLLNELRKAELRAAHVQSGAARWQEVLADQQRALRRAVARDLAERMGVLREAARKKIEDGDPLDQWGELEPWLNQQLNRALAAHHRDVLRRADAVAEATVAQFGIDIGTADLGFDLPALSRLERHVERPAHRRSSSIDVVMTAARGFSVSSTVTGVIFTISTPAALITLPVTAVLGALFAVHSIRSLRQSQVRSAQQAAERAVLTHLVEEEQHTSRLDDGLLDTAYVTLRNHLIELSSELKASARAAVEAASGAAAEGADERRLAESAERVLELDRLMTSARAALDGRPVEAGGRTRA